MLPLGYFDSKNVGDLTQRINDNHRVEGFLTGDTHFYSDFFDTQCTLLIDIHIDLRYFISFDRHISADNKILFVNTGKLWHSQRNIQQN